jgi:glycosyltransferase involved in cell wall biosynthesis
VGDRVREPRYVEAALRAAASDVTVLGEIDEAALAREIATSDAVVLPSSLEGYGIAATEAVRAGKPVIAARTPGLVEALSPCPGAVMFVDDGAPATIAAALTRFAEDEALRARLTAAAARARLPTWEEAEAAFAAIIEAEAPPHA